MHKKNADTGPAIAGASAMQKKEASGYKRNTCNPNGANQYSHSEDLPSDRAGNPRSNSSGTMRLSATIVYQSAVRASSPKHKSGAHGEACELADSRSNGFRNCSGSRRSGHDPAAGRESGSNRRRPECCPEFSRTVEMNERNKIEMFCCVRAHYNNKSMPECFQKKTARPFDRAAILHHGLHKGGPQGGGKQASHKYDSTTGRGSQARRSKNRPRRSQGRGTRRRGALTAVRQ